MSNIIVSIIVPVFKVEETLLRRCIESLMGQMLTAIEILLVDDGCPAGGGAICDEYAGKDSRIRVIHQSNKGISGARNAGLDAACGKYITFVDGDDFISPELCMALAMVRSYYCHPDNPHKSLRKEFRAFCEIPLVAEAIRRASLRSMRL